MPIKLENVGIAVQDIYRLTYLRGPSGILVMLAQDLTKS
jgi:hypothetical protein